MRNFLSLLSFLIGITGSVTAQDFSNKGTDFWVGYGYHQNMVVTGTNGNIQDMRLYFATDQVTTVTISIPSVGYTQTITSGAAPTVLTSAALPKAGAQDVRLFQESTTPENKGIHITSDKPMVAYAHVYNASVSGATILFPTNTLGKEYYSINYTNLSNTPNSNCFFYVIAADTGTTTVEITPKQATLTRAAGVPFTVNLTQGQVYNLMGQYSGTSGVDLTGSRIRSIPSGTGACKKIAVFSGSGRIGIGCPGGGGSSDNYMVQAFPQTAWGKKYLTTTSLSLPNNVFRICVSDPTAAVTVNGAPIAVPLQQNFYYELPPTSQPLRIEADKPITVAQYFPSTGNYCGNSANGSLGDPEVIYLSPVEQNISKVIWNATPNFAITQHFYNVIIPNTGTALSSFKLDGNPVSPTLFVVHPQEPGYSYLKQSVTGNISHLIESDSGFNAIAYGFGQFESYGYNAGTNVKDLFQQVKTSTEFGIESIPSVCTGTPFKFTISLPYQVDSLFWNFLGATNPPGPPLTNVMQVTPIPDSTTIVDGRTLYWYSLPSFYNFNNVGNYPIRITAYAPATAVSCGNTQDIDFILSVSAPPTVDFTYSAPGCVAETVQFTDATTSVRPTYKWYWNFGDPGSGANNTSALKNPSHLFSAPGSYNVRFSSITTAGCVGDTITKVITIAPLPTATATGSAIICAGSPDQVITFTGTGGTAPYTFTYNINGGAAQIATTTGTATTVSFTIPGSTIGTTTYNLTGVQNAGAALCATSPITGQSATVTVNPLPSATITGTTTVCQNTPMPVLTFTGSNGTTPYTFTYNINGGAAQTVSTTGTNNAVTVSAPTTASGTFTYSIVSVSVGGANPCSQTFTTQPTAVVTVNSTPTATISGGASVCINATSPIVTFTGGSGTAPYTFNYTINGAAQPPLVSTGNTATIAVPTTVSGTFTYQLVSVTDNSSTSCLQPQTGNTVFTVYTAAVASFVSTPACESSIVSFNSAASTAGTGTIQSYSWNFGDPASGANNTSTLENPTHLFTGVGSYPVTLTITTSNNCSSIPFTMQLAVSPKPQAGFILPRVCLLDPFAQFTDTSKIASPGTITGWQWNFGDPGSGANNTSTAQNPQHIYTAVGNYTVRLIVISNNGCRDTLNQVLTVNDGNPMSNFLPLNTAANCANDTVSIQNKSTIASGVITRLEIFWDNVAQPTVFDFDDLPVFDRIYKHKYPDFQSPLTRTFNVRVRAYSGQVCFSDRILPITVNASPKVQFNAIPNACYNQPPFQITQASETGGVPGTGVFSGPGVSSTGLFTPAGQPIGVALTIKYVFTSTAGGCKDSASQTITLSDTASAAFTVASPLCEGGAASFTDQSTSATGGTLQTTTWNFGDGTPPETHAPGSTFTHNFPGAGNYTVTMFATGTDACRSTTISRIVTVNPIPRPRFTFDKTDYCLPNAQVVFNSSTSTIADGTESAFTYLWNFGDPASGTANTSTSVNPTHTYTQAGSYTVNLQIRSGAGCLHDTSIVFNRLHPEPFANFDITKPEICLDQDAVFIDRSTGADGTVQNWVWDFGDNSGTSTLQNPAPYRYAAAGTYNVKLSITNSFGCKKDTTKAISVFNYPVVNAGIDRFVLESGSVSLDPVVTATRPQYLWTWDVAAPGGYLNNPRIKNPVSSPLTDVTYTLTVTGAGDCASSDQVFVKLLQAPRIPNTFSPNNDNINDFWVIKYLDTYPNAKVQVFTRTGELVFESRGYPKPWNGTKNGKSLPVDTYYYIIEPENGRAPIRGYVTILK